MFGKESRETLQPQRLDYLNEGLALERQGDYEAALTSYRLAFRDKEWIFPREDCVLLPVENTTTELLAKYLAARLRDELRDVHRLAPDVIRMEVEESFGQTARYEWRK